ncbi:hypothetical protein [Mesorhizobium sp. B1-1-8]|uniref:hypothetical protein n=1 Tax=Mesorhizobium sp. B1-1-8 TaxID=2589976 RepID=UPI001127363A|nr:hypothetical protein [Mesorhizobium sp. B1-1-8]UCI07344.1 hypothetical protein FJ974_26760 [Mesorhizobium sp. B1-1-8]
MIPPEPIDDQSEVSPKRNLKVVVSGSFHRHMPAIREAIKHLQSMGVEVLSPSDSEGVDSANDFVFLAGDTVRSIKAIEDRHLECIRAADFLWVVCPDGYTGSSTCLEIGAAIGFGVPVFAATAAEDTTISQYVTEAMNVADAVSRIRKV